MTTDLRYITGQLRRAQRHLADDRKAGIADALTKALYALDRRIESENVQEIEQRAPWTTDEILAREG